MRKFYLLLGLSLLLISATAQVNVQIHMKQLLNEQKFVHYTVAQVEAGYFIKVSRLQYYLSGFKLIHDGGQVTPATDIYYLVAPSRDSILDLGSFDNITDLEQIEFSIGVDSAHNHLDPTLWPSDHALAPKVPSMHWGWQGGYRFIAFEGNVGAIPDPMVDNYQIHSLDDSNYKAVLLDAHEVVEGNVMRVPITADYTRLLDSLNALGGMIEHGSLGIPRTLINNLATKVFTTEPVTGVVLPTIEGKFKVAPNPSRGEVYLDVEFLENDNLQLIISDLQGRARWIQSISNVSRHQLLQPDLPDGMYIMTVRNSKQLLAFEKLIIQH